MGRKTTIAIVLAAASLLAVLGFAPTLSVASASTITVVTDADNGAGSLRAALAQAEAESGADEIVFDLPPGSTISLESPMPAIDDDLTITGPGSPALTLEVDPDAIMPGDGEFRLLMIAQSTTVKVTGITLHGGKSHYMAGAQGGAIRSFGDLTLEDVVISGSEVRAQPGFHGHLVRGGAISADGRLVIRNSVIRDNVASTNNAPGGARGAGIYMSGRMEIYDSVFTGNVLDAQNAEESGGSAIQVADGTTLISRSYFSDNRGPEPTPLKPITAITNIAGNLTITASTITGNDGGVSFYTVGHTWILGSTLVGGEGGTGPNLAVIPLDRAPLLHVGSSILVAADGWPNCEVLELGEGWSESLGNNIVDDDSCARSHCHSATPDGPDGKCSFMSALKGDRVSTDPMIGNLSPGLRPHFPLLPGSPAINRGNSFGYAYDQRGSRRPRGCPAGQGIDGADVGAFEIQKSSCGKLRAKQAGKRWVVRVRVPGAGKLSINGPGLRHSSREARTARTWINIPVRPKPALRKQLRISGTKQVRVRVLLKTKSGERLKLKTKVRLRPAN